MISCCHFSPRLQKRIEDNKSLTVFFFRVHLPRAFFLAFLFCFRGFLLHNSHNACFACFSRNEEKKNVIRVAQAKLQ